MKDDGLMGREGIRTDEGAKGPLKCHVKGPPKQPKKKTQNEEKSTKNRKDRKKQEKSSKKDVFFILFLIFLPVFVWFSGSFLSFRLVLVLVLHVSPSPC